MINITQCSNQNPNLFIPSFDQPIPSTSQGTGARKKSYSKFDCSPFKHYLKIDESVIISRPPSKRKSLIPDAVTGNEWNASMYRKQQTNNELLQKKKERQMMLQKKT